MCSNIKNVVSIGGGYVGSITMTVLANYHNEINFYVYDVYKNLIDKWNNITDEKSLPIVEPSLYEYYKKVWNNNLFFIDNLSNEIIRKSDVIFICVNTPSLTNCKYGTDISFEELSKIINKGIELSMDNVYKCVKDLTKKIIFLDNGKEEMRNKIIIQKSTVAIKTLENLYNIIHETFTEEKVNISKELIDMKISLLNIPEFLAEGCAIKNLIEPDRIIIGHLKENIESKKSSEKIKKFYLKFIPEEKIIELDSISSEMTKLVSNAFLAQRISSINTISELCEKTNSNINNISKSVGSDNRIGKNYLQASMGFGGSCFKKDILSLIFLFSNLNLHFQSNYWSQVLLMNEYQRLRICKKILDKSKGKVISILGLAFKGNIKDVRCSNSIFLLSYLLNNNVNVKLFDPFSSDEDVQNELKVYDNDYENKYNYNNIHIYTNIFECVKNSSVVAFCNNHSIFKELDLKKLSEIMNQDEQYIFDMYNNFKLEDLKKEKFKIFKLGEFDNTQ
jgi:UDPglucose 6-dehydrogenase